MPNGGLPKLNRLYLRKGRLPDAGHTGEVVITSAFANAHTNRGVALNGLHRFEEQLAAERTAMKLNPFAGANLYNNHGNGYFQLGQIEQGRNHPGPQRPDARTVR